jgi:hypothetical protein
MFFFKTLKKEDFMGHKGKPGGAFGKDSNSTVYKGQQRREWFPVMVNAVINACLPNLKGQEGVVYMGKRSTTLSTKLKRKDQKTIMATLVNSAVAMVHYFGIRIAEAADPEGMWARVSCTPNGKALPEKKLSMRNGSPYRNKYGQIVYQGLSHVAVVTSRGQSGRFLISIYALGSKSKTGTTIEIEETSNSLDMPPELVKRFFMTGGMDEAVPSQEEAEDYIRRHLEGKGEQIKEELWPYISAMALCYRKACGAVNEDGYSLSMLDMEETPAEQPTEETDQTDEEQPTETVAVPEEQPDIAGMQAAEASEEKQPKKKKSRRKTGTDNK